MKDWNRNAYLVCGETLILARVLVGEVQRVARELHSSLSALAKICVLAVCIVVSIAIVESNFRDAILARTDDLPVMRILC